MTGGNDEQESQYLGIVSTHSAGEQMSRKC